MSYEPSKITRWTRPDSYFGAEWPNYFSAYGQHRDSDSLTRSNFRCMLRALGGESETVLIIRESHWAVGWVEWIAIHESNAVALEIADKIHNELEDYPVIDESDWSEEEQQEADEIWANCYSVADRIKYIRDHESQFEFHDYADMIANVRGKYFSGYASELIN